jgi:hypothetical protein
VVLWKWVGVVPPELPFEDPPELPFEDPPELPFEDPPELPLPWALPLPLPVPFPEVGPLEGIVTEVLPEEDPPDATERGVVLWPPDALATSAPIPPVATKTQTLSAPSTFECSSIHPTQPRLGNTGPHAPLARVATRGLHVRNPR